MLMRVYSHNSIMDCGVVYNNNVTSGFVKYIQYQIVNKNQFKLQELIK